MLVKLHPTWTGEESPRADCHTTPFAFYILSVDESSHWRMATFNQQCLCAPILQMVPFNQYKGLKRYRQTWNCVYCNFI